MWNSREAVSRGISTVAVVLALAAAALHGQTTPSAMNNPYTLVTNWPALGPGMKWGAAIGLIPDGQGGVWMHFRSEPAINHFDASGKLLHSFGQGVFVQAHGFCRDRDGNFWAGDSGPFRDDPSTKGRGFTLHKFSPEGKLLATLGKPGVSKAGPDTFIGPTACAIAPNGDVIVADGHWPRPSDAQQDGDRLVRLTKEGKFIRDYGRMGTGPGEFMGPHSLAFDSQGRLFVADRSNNRVQVFDRDLNFLDDWRHFGRPSGVAILKDDTIVVSDSESGFPIDGPSIAPEGGGSSRRNPGWRNGVRIGSANDGSLTQFIPDTRPEGLAADEHGNIFAGLTGGCDKSPSGGCLQKWVRGRSTAGAGVVSQSPQPAASTAVTKGEVEAVLRHPDGGGDRQIRVVDVGKLNVGVGVLHRGAVKDTGWPVRGLSHTLVTEVYYITSGSGTLVTAGTIVDQKPMPADAEVVKVAVGPSVTGASQNGQTRLVSAGDIVVIPAGMFHGWKEVPDHVTYVSIRPDPDRVLPVGYVNPAIK